MPVGGLRKGLNLFDAVAIVTIIGSGIFLIPSAIAVQLHSLAAVLLVWVVVGILTLFGAMSLAEIGSIFPGTGGLCTYRWQASGPLLAFLYAWALLVMTHSGSIAALGVAFGLYAGQVLPLTMIEMKLLTILSIVALTTISCIGIRSGKLVQDIVVILISVLGPLNDMILTDPRVYYAMACEGVFPRAFGRLSNRHNTPIVALAVQGVWAATLAALGSYQQLFTDVIFTAWTFYGLAVAAFLVLRRTQPQLERLFSVPGYPWLSLLFCATAAGVIFSTMVERPGGASVGLGLLAIGVPVYFLGKASRQASPRERTSA